MLSWGGSIFISVTMSGIDDSGLTFQLRAIIGDALFSSSMQRNSTFNGPLSSSVISTVSLRTSFQVVPCRYWKCIDLRVIDVDNLIDSFPPSTGSYGSTTTIRRSGRGKICQVRVRTFEKRSDSSMLRNSKTRSSFEIFARVSRSFGMSIHRKSLSLRYWNRIDSSLAACPIKTIVKSLPTTGFLGEIIFKKESMGGGDVKLLAMIGSFLGWQSVLLVYFLAPILALPLGLFVKFAKRSDVIPFGPFLSL
ncbi:MAG: prepilin peptidase, partial [Planctomycetes bacterium]|nr:prepilin peptidase [Planctomycetota bacterium]